MSSARPVSPASSAAATGKPEDRRPMARMVMARMVAAAGIACRVATGLAFATLILAVLVQVVGRLAGASPVWTEELTRFALLFLAAFGTGLAYRSGDLVAVDMVCAALPGPWPRRLRLVAAALTAILCAGLVLPAWTFTAIGAMQTSPALGWRMDLIHASVLVLVVVLCAVAAAHGLALLAGRPDDRTDQGDRTDRNDGGGETPA